MKKIIVVGDTHLHPHKAFADGHGRENTRLKHTLDNLRESLLHARREECPWLHAGDQVHTIGFAQNAVLNEWIGLLNGFPDVEKYFVWGNHDARSAGDQITEEETATSVLVFGLQRAWILGSRMGILTARNGLRIYGEGFQPKHNLQFPSWPPTKPVDIGLFHQTVAGSMMPSGIRMDDGLPQEWLFKQFRLSVVGDVHQPQIFEDGKGHLILVPGALEQHNFGDKGDRGYWEVTFEDSGEISCKMWPASSPRFLTVENVSQVKNDGNFYRITTPTDPRDLPPGAVALSAPPTVIEQRTLVPSGAGPAEVLGVWLSVNPVPADRRQRYFDRGRQLLEAEGSSELRPIRLKSASLKSFLCYSEASFVVQDGITLVLGQGRDFTSNGAGKTTLFEAIFWALFGRTTKGMDANDVIQRGQNECSVTLVFDDLMVTRTRKKDGTGALSVSNIANFGDSAGVLGQWGGTQKDVTANLQKYLGLTPELFQALAYFSQSKLVLFSQATDSERKAMLSDLCGLDIYQKAATAARSQAARTEQEISQLSGNIGLFEAALQEASDRRMRLSIKSMDWAAEAESVKATNLSKIAGLQAQKGVIDLEWGEFEDGLQLRLIQESASILERQSEIETKACEQLSGSLNAAKAEYEKWKAEHSSPLPEEDRILSRQKELQVEIAQVTEVLQVAQSGVSGHTVIERTALKDIEKIEAAPSNCPTCGAAIDLTSQRSRLEEIRAALKIAQDGKEIEGKIVADASARLRMLNDQIRQLEGLATESRHRRATIQDYEARIFGLERMLDTQVSDLVRSQMDTLQKQAEAAIENEKRLKKKDFDYRYLDLLNQIKVLEDQLRRYEVNPYADELAQAEKAQQDKAATVQQAKEKKELLVDEERLLDYWATGFSRSGIQSLLMEEVAGEFNNIRTAVFPTLTRGIYDVQFSTTSTTSTGEAREKTDFIIRDRGALVSYESLSGGQRRRIDLGVMLTLALAVAKTRNIPGVFGLLVLDEVFGFLDQDGVEALYEILGEVNRIVPSIYAVTHNPSLMSLFRRTLTVVQNEYGVSSLEESAA